MTSNNFDTNSSESKGTPRYQPPTNYSTDPTAAPPWVGSSQPAEPWSNYQTPSEVYSTQPVQDDLYRRAVERANAKMKFYKHLSSYLIVNGFLWFIALMTSHGNFWAVSWPLWVTVFWGIGVVSDYFKTFGFSENTRQRLIEDELRKMRR
jgi:hypothetical protein